MKAKEVKSVYEENPELKEVGTVTQYYKYLKTVFPESKFNDIVYHGTSAKFENFKSPYNLTFDYFFTKDIELALLNSKKRSGAQRIIKAILNSKNPWNYSIEGGGDEVASFHFDKYAKKGYDTMINKNEIAVYGPEQIHILGSKKDIEGFKKYVEGKGKNSNLEKKVLTSILGLVFLASIFFLSLNLTGNVIGHISKAGSNIIGIVLFLLSVFGFFIYRKLSS